MIVVCCLQLQNQTRRNSNYLGMGRFVHILSSRKYMKRIAKFYKVSLEQFIKDCRGCGINFTDETLTAVWESIELPKRATSGSAGYDFKSPFVLEFNKPRTTHKFPTGIRCQMENEYVLKCYPRSGLGFKYRLQLDNCVGVIDADYFFSDNEGHIHAKLTNDSESTFTINPNDGFMQGIFIEYGITVDDDVQSIRNGGFGSTDKK